MNSRVPYVYMPPPEHRDLVANAARDRVSLEHHSGGRGDDERHDVRSGNAVRVALGLLAVALAASLPPPQAAAAPENEYLVVRRLPNGDNVTLDTFAYDETSQTDEQRIRQITLDAARQQRTNNPAWRIIIYGPTNGGPYTDDDIIWDSAINL